MRKLPAIKEDFPFVENLGDAMIGDGCSGCFKKRPSYRGDFASGNDFCVVWRSTVKIPDLSVLQMFCPFDFIEDILEVWHFTSGIEYCEVIFLCDHCHAVAREAHDQGTDHARLTS